MVTSSECSEGEIDSYLNLVVNQAENELWRCGPMLINRLLLPVAIECDHCDRIDKGLIVSIVSLVPTTTNYKRQTISYHIHVSWLYHIVVPIGWPLQYSFRAVFLNDSINFCGAHIRAYHRTDTYKDPGFACLSWKYA